MGREEGWLAEHMLILGLSPKVKKFTSRSFPALVAKTTVPPKALKAGKCNVTMISLIKPSADNVAPANPRVFGGARP